MAVARVDAAGSFICALKLARSELARFAGSIEVFAVLFEQNVVLDHPPVQDEVEEADFTGFDADLIDGIEAAGEGLAVRVEKAIDGNRTAGPEDPDGRGTRRDSEWRIERRWTRNAEADDSLRVGDREQVAIKALHAAIKRALHFDDARAGRRAP